MELKIRLQTIIGIILITIGVIIILYGVFQAYIHMAQIETLWETEQTPPSQFETRKLIEAFYWLFTILIEILSGFFVATIGTKISKK